jgi:protein O-GlcNAc transferase
LGSNRLSRAAEAFQRATVAFQAGDVGRAESLCRKTRELAPAFHGASLMLGLLLRRRGALREAASELVRATKLAPSDFDSSYEAATALRLARRPAEAVAHYREALRLRPGLAACHNDLGVALLDLWQLDEAVACFERALELAPRLAEAHENLANALKDLGRVSEAVPAYRRALELRPDRHVHSNLLFAMMFDPASNEQAILEDAKRFQARYLELRSGELLPPASADGGERRLRIGYVSADFREHVQMLFMLPLLRDHDREAVEVFCYSNVEVPDAVTELYVARADRFRSIAALDDTAAARMIREDRIDVLIDLTMHMARGRLGVFARRPAPVQVAWLAYPGTTGAECIDFRLSDPQLDPPGTDARSSERTVRLPETFWCFEPFGPRPPVSELPAAKQGQVTFGSLNNFCKTNEQTFALWARVLRAMPTSRLLLLSPPGSARRRTKQRFEQEGVAPERLELVDFQPREAYLKTYWRVDVVLDTWPCHGHTTSLDAWWMGVPVVSLVSDRLVGRAGLSQARNLGLDELCVESPDDFCARAVSLGSDLERLASLRRTLRERIERSPLMDGRRFARNLEQTLRELFRDHARTPRMAR